MKNVGAWYAFVTLGVLLGKEYLDWVWWFNWEDEDEENPTRLLRALWGAWCKLRNAYLGLCSRFWWPVERKFTAIWRHFVPSEPYYEPIDQDGRTATEWLLIRIVGVWEMEDWYKDEYDWAVKRKWDELLKSPEKTENPQSGRTAQC